MRLKLMLVNGPEHAPAVVVNGNYAVFGSDPACNITFDSNGGAVAPRHCGLVDENGSLFLENLSDAHVTWHNGARISGRSPFKCGDDFQLAANGPRIKSFAMDALESGAGDVRAPSDESYCDPTVIALGGISPASQTARWGDGPPPVPANRAQMPSARQLPPGYEFVSELGRGGMGVVFLARQIRPQRLVALKMIIHGTLANSKEILRFEGEAQAIAEIRHPNVAEIYEVGDFNGAPYYTMEYFKGGTLATFLNRKPQEPKKAAELLKKIALGIQAAHDSKRIHRDLKPANILLNDLQEPKIVDFGLAKLIENAPNLGDITKSNAIVGTPEYMSPEQARGESAATGVTSDVYALGVILYEMLVGHPPFQAPNLRQLLLMVSDDEPKAPRSLLPGIPVDLETICLTAMNKDSARRYSTASAMSDDLDRFLTFRPIRARPSSVIEVATKWGRRNPSKVVIAAAIFISILSYVIFLKSFSLHLESEKNKAVADFSKSQEQINNYIKGDELWSRAQAEIASHDYVAARFLAASSIGYNGFSNPRNDADQKLFEKTHPRYFPAGEAEKRGIGRFLADSDGALIWASDPARNRDHPIGQLVVSPDGRFIASADDGTRATESVQELAAEQWDLVTIWDVRNLTRHRTLQTRHHKVKAMAISPDGKYLATGGEDQTIRFWNLEDATEEEDFSIKERNNVLALAYLPDGRRLVAACDGRRVHCWDLQTKEVLYELPDYVWQPRAIAIFPDGTRLVSAAPQMTRIADARTGNLLCQITNDTPAVACSPDSKFFVIAMDNVLSLRRPDGREFAKLEGHKNSVTAIVFTPDGSTLISAGKDSTIRFWDVSFPDANQHAEYAHLGGYVGTPTRLAVAPDGQTLISGNEFGMIALWHVPIPRRTLRHFQEEVRLAHFSPDNSKIIAFSSSQIMDRRIRIIDAVTEQEIRGIPFVYPLESMAVTRDFSTFAAACCNRSIYLGDTTTGTVECFATGSARINHLAFSNDAKSLVACDLDRVIRVWDMPSRRIRFDLPQRPTDVIGVDVSPDGGHFAICEHSGEISIFDLKNGRNEASFGTQPKRVNCIAYSQDGTRLITGGADSQVRIWDMAARREIARLSGHESDVMSVAFAHDGLTAVSGGNDNTVRLWDLNTKEERKRFAGHSDWVTSVAFSADDRQIVSASWDSTVRIWDVPQGREILSGMAQFLRFSDAKIKFVEKPDESAAQIALPQSSYLSILHSNMPPAEQNRLLFDNFCCAKNLNAARLIARRIDDKAVRQRCEQLLEYLEAYWKMRTGTQN